VFPPQINAPLTLMGDKFAVEKPALKTVTCLHDMCCNTNNRTAPSIPAIQKTKFPNDNTAS